MTTYIDPALQLFLVATLPEYGVGRQARTTRLGAVDLRDIEPGDVQRLDSVRHIAELQRVGSAHAAAYVDAAHLEGSLR